MLPPNFAEILLASTPPQAELDQSSADRKARQVNPNTREKLLQNTTNLAVWLERCRAAGVRAVPATFSADIVVAEIFDAIDGKGEISSIKRALAWLEENNTPGTMWRWLHCASMDIKHTMAHGGTLGKRIPLMVDDPRLVDILFEVNVPTTRIAVRPIVAAQRHTGFPVEFRCYVSGPGEVAVSNYYPQVCLPEGFRPARRGVGAPAPAAGRHAVHRRFHTGTPPGT